MQQLPYYGGNPYSDTTSSSDYYELKCEVKRLKSELTELKNEMTKFKEFMSTKGSFTDFKVFKFNEEEEKRKKAQEMRNITERLHMTRLYSM